MRGSSGQIVVPETLCKPIKSDREDRPARTGSPGEAAGPPRPGSQQSKPGEDEAMRKPWITSLALALGLLATGVRGDDDWGAPTQALRPALAKPAGVSAKSGSVPAPGAETGWGLSPARPRP